MCPTDRPGSIVVLLVALSGACSGSSGSDDPFADVDGGPRATVEGGTDAQPETNPGSGGGGGGGSCIPPLARCEAGGRECCAGGACVEQDGESRCVETCATRFDCGSLCCLEMGGQKLCAAADLCPPLPCSEVGGSCLQPGPSCCDGLTCVASNAPEFSGCRKPCELDTECETGCCVPYANNEGGFCADASACGCAGNDQTCGGTKRCCDGLSCTTFDSTGEFVCKPACATNDDCSTRCCRPITGTSDSACLPEQWCAP